MSKARNNVDKLRDAVSVRDFGAVGDGVTSDAAAFAAAAATNQAYIAQNAVYVRSGGPQPMALAAFKTIGATDVNAGKFLEWREVTNPTGTTGYAVRFATYTKTGNTSSGNNEISDTLITRHDSITNGAVWNRWNVIQSPLPVGSGLLNAPTLTQSYYIVNSEVNPQNRGAGAAAWQPEPRLWANPVGGEQMVAETQDFTATLGNTRIGRNIAFGYCVSKSPYTQNVGNFEHAKFWNAFLVAPNAIGFGGYGLLQTGFFDYPTAITVAAGGSGYTAGDLLTFNTGTDQNFNQNSTVKVLTVSGSGAVLTAELYASGYYQTAPSFPQTVTGGTGAGATFNATMATFSAVSPRAAIGISGRWLYGIDFCVSPTARYAKTDFGAIRLANGATGGIYGLNSTETANIGLAWLGSDNLVYVAGQRIITRQAWVPTFTADAGTLTTVTVVSARYSQADGLIQFALSFELVDKGTGTGAIRFTLPANASAHTFVGSGANVTDGLTMFVACVNGGANVVRCARYDGVDPMINGKSYTVTATYEAAAV